jgi:hypothetical protein
MNGTVIFGVALIIVGLFFAGSWMLPMLIGGVAVAAYGAFAPVNLPPPGDQAPAGDDPFV